MDVLKSIAAVLGVSEWGVNGQNMPYNLHLCSTFFGFADCIDSAGILATASASMLIGGPGVAARLRAGALHCACKYPLSLFTICCVSKRFAAP